jgi:predicted metalloprotease with PDZ domain
MPVFELGFDFDKFAKDRVVADLDPNSSAYAAGLRNGQKRNGGVSLAFGDTTKVVELKVKDDEGEKTIKFLPIARTRLDIPQYVLVQ